MNVTENQIYLETRKILYYNSNEIYHFYKFCHFALILEMQLLHLRNCFRKLPTHLRSSCRYWTHFGFFTAAVLRNDLIRKKFDSSGAYMLTMKLSEAVQITDLFFPSTQTERWVKRLHLGF